MEANQSKPPAFSLMFAIILIIMAVFKMSSGEVTGNSYMFVCVILILILSLNSFQVGKDTYMLVFVIALIYLTVSTKEGSALFESLGLLRCEVLLVTAIILISMLLINMNNWNMDLKNKNGGGEVVKEVTIEGMENMDLEADGEKSFCDKYQSNPDELNKQCKKFDKKSCDIPNCCVWLNGSSGVAGSNLGPTFQTDDDMKDIDVKYYLHQGKCYGDCPADEKKQ